MNGPGIDNKLRVQTGSSVNYFLADHLGSTNALTDASGAITSQASYDAFGNQIGNLATRYGFTGREKDPFTGLMHFRARQYDPKLGRFISEDPIGFGGGDINFYGYVGNNPQNFRDPTGKVPLLVIVGGVWLAIEIAGTIYDIYDLGSTIVDPCSSWTDVGLGAGGLALGAVAPGGGYGTGLKGGKKLFFGGRRGSATTRNQLDDVRDEFLDSNPDFRHVGGGRDRGTGIDIPEEYIPNPNGGRSGGSYPDLTFEGSDGIRERRKNAAKH